MTWHGIEGHDRVAEQFRQSLARGRMASSFLFVGPPGVGKRAFALKLAQTLLCETRPESKCDPCETCPACQQVAAGTHPDLMAISKPEDRSFIPVELFIGKKERRMREGLCHDISLKPFRGGRKMAIIDDADYLNQEGANCLLKTLEEPPPKSVLVLIGTSLQRQLPTIRSRCQTVRFGALAAEVVADLLLSRGIAAERSEAERLAELSEGSLERAIDLSDPALCEFRQVLLNQLTNLDAGQRRLAVELSALVDEAGSEARSRRVRSKLLFDFCVQFYRGLMQRLEGIEIVGDDVLKSAVDSAAARWPHDAETAAACLDRCLDAQQQVDRNANQATLLECWLDDLAKITRQGYAPLVQ